MLSKVKNTITNFLETAFRFRWPIYAVTFGLLLLFQINFSSIGEYSAILTETNGPEIGGTILGVSRPIRSDEYLVTTPYYFNQVDHGFPVISHAMSIDGQNMIVGYNSPVADITVLAKPLNWGYILFGKATGLSWYWCLKILLLFAFAFETMLVLTKKSKLLSLLGALLLAYGPPTQWWFVPHAADSLLWALGIFTCVYYYMTTQKRWLKNLLTITTPLVILEFVIAIYPSSQVGLGLIIGVLLIAVMCRDHIRLFPSKDTRKNKKATILFNSRAETIRHLLMILFTIGLITYFIITCKDALLASLSTVYPGSRVVTGGNASIFNLMTDLTTVFLPYKVIPYSNQCEVSTYIHFGLFFVMLSPILIRNLRREKHDSWKIGVGLLALIVAFAIFYCIGFPTPLAIVTLFSRINRMDIIIGVAFVFFTIWGIHSMHILKQKPKLWLYLLCIVIYCGLYFRSITSDQLSYVSAKYLLAEIGVFAIILALYYKHQVIGILLTIAVVAVASFPINPLVSGISDITNHPSATVINEIAHSDDSYWISTSNLLSGYALANGANVINAVNFYPDFTKWDILDPEHQYEDEWNRYAHIIFNFSNDGTISISSPQDDVINLSAPLDIVADALHVKYIISPYALDDLESDTYHVINIHTDSNVYIYQIAEVTNE